jgi:glycosyltransferase involved in cell wall biosynthesis
MAVKLPVIAPDNTSVPEILGDDRGWRIKSGHTPSHWIIKENDNERMRPLMDVEQAANTIEYIMNNPDEAARRADNAYEWIKKNTWTDICKQWKSLFEEAKVSLDKKRKFLSILNQGK